MSQTRCSRARITRQTVFLPEVCLLSLKPVTYAVRSCACVSRRTRALPQVLTFDREFTSTTARDYLELLTYLSWSIPAVESLTFADSSVAATVLDDERAVTRSISRRTIDQT